MLVSLTPNGLEALYPSDGKSVEITMEGTVIRYEAIGFRIVVPSQHAAEREFAAELQILHRKIDGTEAPSFLAFGVWIDVDIDSEDEKTIPPSDEQQALTIQTIFGEILVEWQTAVDLIEASCDPSGETIPQEIDTITAPAVVGRGDEQNFANNPIRRRTLDTDHKSSVEALYDWVSSSSSSSSSTPSSSHYKFEAKAACDANEQKSVLWYLAELPVKISKNQLATMTILMESYKDPSSCQPVSLDPDAANSNPFDANNANLTKVCMEESTGEISETSGSSALGTFGAVSLGLGLLAALIL